MVISTCNIGHFTLCIVVLTSIDTDCISVFLHIYTVQVATCFPMCFSLYCCHCVLLQVTKVTKVVVMNCAEIEIQSAKCSPGDLSESSLWGSLQYVQNNRSNYLQPYRAILQAGMYGYSMRHICMLFDLAFFFLPSFSSLIKTCVVIFSLSLPVTNTGAAGSCTTAVFSPFSSF